MSSFPMQLVLFMAVLWTQECIGLAQDHIKFTGYIKLYSGTYYQHNLLTINFNMPNRCYNVNCTNIDDNIKSAKWDGLPITGLAGKAYLTFYADVNCKGNKTTVLLPHNGGVREFVYPDGISSFMVRSESRKRRHGFANVCSWTGAGTLGGYVVEEQNDSR